MSSGLIDIMKRASLDVMDANQMCDLRFGIISSVKPLKVQITNQFTIPESLLIVPQHLTKRTIPVNIELDQDNPSDDVTGIGERLLTLDNSLKLGDKVALIRKTGGQSYYILDRI